MSQDRFVRETREEIRDLSDGFVAIEGDPDEETLAEMFRTAHSLKGTLGMEGQNGASELAHAIEDVLEAVRSGAVEPEGEVIDYGLEATDTLQSMVTEAVRHGETETDPRPLIEDLHGITGSAPSPDEHSERAKKEPTVSDRNGGTTESNADTGTDTNTDMGVGTDPVESGDDDLSAEEALEAVSEFDDLDAVTDRMDDGDTDAFEDLQGGGSFDDLDDDGTFEDLEESEAFEDLDDTFDDLDEGGAFEDSGAGSTAEQGAPEQGHSPEEAAVPFDDEEQVESGDAFIWIKEEVEDEDTTVDELQSEIESESFGEFDDEDDMSIQELLEIEPDEPTGTDTGGPAPSVDRSASAGSREGERSETDRDLGIGSDADGSLGSDTSADGTLDTGSDGATRADDGVGAGQNAGEADTEVRADAGADEAVDERDALSRVLDALDPDGDEQERTGGEPRAPGERDTGSSSEEGEPAPTAGAGRSEERSTAGEGSFEDPDLPDVSLGAEGSAEGLSEAGDVSFGAEPGTEELEARFEGLFDGDEEAEASTEVAPTFAESALPTDRFRPDSGGPAIAPERQPGDVDSLTVDIDVADELLTLTERLSMRVRELSRTDGESVEDTAESLRTVTRDLQRAVMDVRLMPLETVTDGLDRVVRDVARETGTEATLRVEGASIQLDRSIIERIGDPIVHLVRNAVDHGIEDPDHREAVGKPRTGTVVVRAERVGEDVRIEIEDDGGGVDTDAVRDAAVEAGVLDAATAERLPEEEAVELLFDSGLTTRREVTETSGRGVGLDVVERTVTALGGSVHVESTPGRGTTVSLRVPATVVVDEVLFVEAGARQFAVPVADIDHVEVGGDSVTGGPVLGLARADRTVDLGRALDVPVRRDPSATVYVTGGGERLGLECTDVGDRREVVITPYDDLLAAIPGISGATTGSDGQLIHVLDTDDL